MIFFSDGHFSSAFEALGFYSSADFIELGVVFGVSEEEVRGHMAKFMGTRGAVERMIAESRLSAEAKTRYLAKYADRLRAISQ